MARSIHGVVEPLRKKLEARLVELLDLPIERFSLDAEEERTFKELRCYFIATFRFETDWHRYRFEINWGEACDATPEPDEPAPDFVDALKLWHERDELRRQLRERHAQSVAYYIRKQIGKVKP